MTDITMLTMETVSGMLQNQALSPVDLVEACLARIEALQPELNAFVYLDADGHGTRLMLLNRK